MTNTNQIKNQNQNVLNDLKTILEEYNTFKNDRKKTSVYFQKLNLIQKIQKVNAYCLRLFESKNKNGFLQIIDHDFWKYYLKKFYNANHVFLQEDQNGLFVLYESESDLAKCLDFESYAKKILNDQKEKQKAKKQDLLNKNIKEFKILNYTKEDLQAIVLQCQKQIKLLNK